jgi:hypothetical protein
MPFTGIYTLFSLFIVLAIFVFTLYKRGLKHAVLLSSLSLVVMVAIFVVFLTVALNNM